MNFMAKTKGKRGEIYIYEGIGEGWFGGITAKTFADALRDLGKVDALDIYVNSPGGSVFDGIAIYNQIRRFSGERIVHIDGIAASIASVIAMAGDEINIASNGTVMIHDPWGAAFGTAEAMRKTADTLDQVRDTILDTYVAKTGGKKEQISEWMTAETWMTADQAVERGFATQKTEDKNVKAAFPMLDKFRNTPQHLRAGVNLDARSMIARVNMRAHKLNPGASPAKT